MDHAVKLTINGETREFPMGITYKEVVKEYGKDQPGPCYSCNCRRQDL